MGEVDEVISLELELLDPVRRADADRLEALLADDFVEVGRSGRVWQRHDIIAELAADPSMLDVLVGELAGQLVGPGLVMVRYTTERDADTVHRTGWWRREGSGWRCWFHQATIVESGGEESAVRRADRPVTVDDIETALREVGVTSGSTVIVHCSLSRLGWVVGQAVAVVRALESVVGAAGTIVMPAHTGVGDPSMWEAPPVPESWWSTIRDSWPAFDPSLTPMRQMGAVAECFARQPGVVHSGHPALGFVAVGSRAHELMHPHPLEDALGEGSPLSRLYDASADVVLLGVGHDNNTSLHLSETRALGADAPIVSDGAPLVTDGERRWVEYVHVDYDASDFAAVGEAYVEAGGSQWRAPLGAGAVRRFPMRELVDFAAPWIAVHRRTHTA